jgi:hypothetical protein
VRAPGLLPLFARRWAEVRDGELLLWHSSEASRSLNETPARAIALRGASVFQIARVGARRWALAIVGTDGVEAAVLAAEREAELGPWLRTLRAVAYDRGTRAPLEAAGALEPACGRRRAVFFYGRGGGGHLASANAVRDCLTTQLAPHAASLLRRACEPSAAASPLAPLARESIELVDIARLVDAMVLGEAVARRLPLNGDDLYNLALAAGLYSLADLITATGARCSSLPSRR